LTIYVIVLFIDIGRIVGYHCFKLSIHTYLLRINGVTKKRK